MRRSAFKVEDHPFDYKDFEGNIPEGNYGAGSVIIWDQGTYQASDLKGPKKDQEKHLLYHLYKGGIDITLQGKRLKGKFRLTHVPGGGDRWLLVKLKDEHATKKEITDIATSVVSGVTLEEMAKHKGAATWQSNRKSVSVPAHDPIGRLLKKGRKASKPQRVKPMGATLHPGPFDNEDWLYEVKFDGYRIISHLQDGKAVLHTKGHLDYSDNFRMVTTALQEMKINAILDGEVVAVNEQGRPDFQELQRKHPRLPLKYYVFDILWVNGHDLTGLPLTDRKEILQAVLPDGDVVKLSESFDDGVALFEQVKQLGLEGVIAKKRDSTYVQYRSKEWRKIKTSTEADVVLGGWTESDTGAAFRSLLFGYYEDGKLCYFSHAGHGYNSKNVPLIVSTLKRLATKRKPFVGEVETSTKAHWVKPERVIRIRFDDVTGSGMTRKPVLFLGFRNDMEPKGVTNPIAELKTVAGQKVNTKASTAELSKKATSKSGDRSGSSAASNWPELDKQPVSRRDTLEVEGHEVELTNIDREYWDGITKTDLISYYIRMAPYILPHLKDRPLSLHIKHIAPAAPGLYIKDMEGRQPAFAQVHSTPRKHKKKGKRDVIDYLICNNIATLVYAINLGCIDLNPWTSTIHDPDHPDFIIIDLDPSDNDFSKAITTAQAAKQFFDEHKLKSFVKTSGKTGIHLFLPCSGFSFSDVRTIAENICSGIHQFVPSITTTEISVSSRGNKLYIDPNQNDYADTVAAVYCARPHGKPTVSTPLEWREVKDGLSMETFTLPTIERRIQRKGDLFLPVMDRTIGDKNTRSLLQFLGS